MKGAVGMHRVLKEEKKLQKIKNVNVLETYTGSPYIWSLEVPSEICGHSFKVKPGRKKRCISAALTTSSGSGMD